MLPLLLGAAAVIGVGLQAKGMRDQRKAAKRQNEIARKRENIQASRSRIRALRDSRRAAAQLSAMGANSGIGGSTIAGAQASLSTQTAANIGQANQMDALGQQSLNAQADMQKSQQLQQLGQLVQSSSVQGLNQIGG